MGKDTAQPQGEPFEDYDRFAYYYDLHYQQVKFDYDFYLELAGRFGPGAKILELACGSGRLFMPLLEAGYNLTGVDLSIEMLDLARQKVATLAPEFQQKGRLLVGDMRRLEEVVGGEEFDLIILGFNSFQHLLTPADQHACLASACRHLAPRGRFVLAVLNPESDTRDPAKNRMEYYGSSVNPLRQSKINLMVSTTDYPAEQLRRLLYIFYENLPDGTTEKIVAPLTMRYAYRAELDLLLQQAGFAVENLYGDYKFEKFSKESPRLIYICRQA